MKYFVLKFLLLLTKKLENLKIIRMIKTRNRKFPHSDLNELISYFLL